MIRKHKMVDNIFVTIKIEELGFTIVGFTE